MSHLGKWSLLLLLASNLAWSQSTKSSIPALHNDSVTSSAQAPATTDAPSAPAPASPDSTGIEVIKRQKADYPIAAAQRGIQGTVWVKLVISETGDVENVEVISGDPILAESALNATRKFKFKPFIKNGKPVKVATKMPFDFFFSDKVMDKGVSADMTAVMKKPAPASAPADSSPDAKPPLRVRVSQGVSQGMLMHQIAPVYPASARQNHVQGTVVMSAVIGKDGTLQKLTPVSGPPELVSAAVGAVEQWRYKPYMLKGEPVEVETLITVNFRLSR